MVVITQVAGQFTYVQYVAIRRTKIRFFRIEPRLVRDEPWPDGEFPIGELRDDVETRVATGDRYLAAHHENHLALLGAHEPGHSCVSLYRIRDDNLPDQEVDGVVSPLHLDEAANIAEGSHFVFFGRNVVGAVIRRETPSRITSAKVFEQLLAPTKRSAVLLPLVRPDVMDLLEGNDVTAATIRVSAGNAEALSAMSSGLGEASRRLTDRASARAIEIRLTADRGQAAKRAFTSRVLNMVRPVADEPAGIEALRVDYLSEEAGRQTVNLLGDDITVFRDVQVPTSRRFLTPESAYEAIIDGYNDAIEQLNRSIALDDAPSQEGLA